MSISYNQYIKRVELKELEKIKEGEPGKTWEPESQSSAYFRLYTSRSLLKPLEPVEMSWSARPYHVTRPHTKPSSHPIQLQSLQTLVSAPSTPVPVPSALEQAIADASTEVGTSSAFMSKDELRRAVKKKLRKLDVSKEDINAAVEKAMANISSKSKRVVDEQQRDRILNNLMKISLKQYEGMSHVGQELAEAEEDITLTQVLEIADRPSTPKKYKRSEFQNELDTLYGVVSDSERVCLQMRQLTDTMEQCVFDLERNIHQQNLYFSLP